MGWNRQLFVFFGLLFLEDLMNLILTILTWLFIYAVFASLTEGLLHFVVTLGFVLIFMLVTIFISFFWDLVLPQ